MYASVESYKGDFYILDEYAALLLKVDKNRLIQLYIDRIEIFLANNTGRKFYKVAVRYIRKIKQYGAKKKARKLTEKLRIIYKNRPALQDEFRHL